MQTVCQLCEREQQKKRVCLPVRCEHANEWPCGKKDRTGERENKVSDIFHTTSFPEDSIKSTDYAAIVHV